MKCKNDQIRLCSDYVVNDCSVVTVDSIRHGRNLVCSEKFVSLYRIEMFYIMAPKSVELTHMVSGRASFTVLRLNEVTIQLYCC
jgi:hypothetical protein